MRITQKQNVFFSCLNQLRHCHVCRLEIIAQGAVDIFSTDTAIHHKDRHLLCRFPNVLYLLGILIILCIAGTDEHQPVNSLLKNGIDGDPPLFVIIAAAVQDAVITVLLEVLLQISDRPRHIGICHIRAHESDRFHRVQTQAPREYIRCVVVFLHHLAYTPLGLFTDHWTVVYHS